MHDYVFSKDYNILNFSLYYIDAKVPSQYWHGTLHDLQNNLRDIALRYNNKEIIIVEVTYPFTADENDGLENIICFQTTRGDPAIPEANLR